MTRKEAAKAIRAKLRAKGYNARQVNVRSKPCTYSGAVDITINDPAISKQAIKEIACGYERIDRCSYSGEILSGGNLYIDVSYSEAAKDILVGNDRPKIEKALAKAATSLGIVVAIDDTEYSVSIRRDGRGVTVWDKDNRPFSAYNSALSVAECIALR